MAAGPTPAEIAAATRKALQRIATANAGRYERATRDSVARAVSNRPDDLGLTWAATVQVTRASNGEAFLRTIITVVKIVDGNPRLYTRGGYGVTVEGVKAGWRALHLPDAPGRAGDYAHLFGEGTFNQVWGFRFAFGRGAAALTVLDRETGAELVLTGVELDALAPQAFRALRADRDDTPDTAEARHRRDALGLALLAREGWTPSTDWRLAAQFFTLEPSRLGEPI